MRAPLLRATLVGLGLLLGGGLVEAGLRVVGFSYPTFFMTDDLTGVWHRPGARGYFVTEGFGFVEMNQRGLRGPEYQESKPPSTFRVALLGDSFTEALQVPLEETFGSLLESELSRCDGLAGRRVEVMNFGVSGFGTAQALLTFRHRASRYSPDLVLLAFFTGNDVRNNSKALERHDPLRPFFTLGEDRTLIEDVSFRDDPVYKRRQSRFRKFERAASDRLRVLQLMKRVSHLASARQAGDGVSAQDGIDDEIYLTPRTKEWERAWDVTEALVAQLGSEAREAGAAFLLVTLSNGIQVHPDRAVRARFMRALGVENLFYPERRMTRIAGRAHIELLTLAPMMQSLAESDGAYFHGFSNTALGAGHWNRDGHAVASQAMARKVCGMVGGT